jgi:uncharacterized protein (DUF362 family)
MPADTRSRVCLRAVTGGDLRFPIRACLERIDWEQAIPRDASVIIKPNLCTAVPDKVEASNTSPALAEAVVEVLASRTRRIAIVESDGLRQTADAAFAASGYTALARRLGVSLVNLSRAPWRRVPLEPAGPVELPVPLLDADVLVTLPVLKTHALTYFTGALKNQWGCLPQYDRILFHKWLDELVVSLNARVPPRLAIMDGIIGMEGRGPANGKPRRLDVVLASRDPVAIDAAAMRLVGLDPGRARHVMRAADRGLGVVAPASIELDGDWAVHACRFEPAIRDRAIAAMDYMSRYRWFVKYALEKDYIFYPVRAMVQLLRRAGVVEGG